MKSQRGNQTHLAPVVTKRRCAIYTRKSSDEGLDQEYNSLEAQRDDLVQHRPEARPKGVKRAVPGLGGGIALHPALGHGIADFAGDEIG